MFGSFARDARARLLALSARALPPRWPLFPPPRASHTRAQSILMNNAAWVLRRAPLFLLAGDGEHRFQPVHVRDFAELLLEVL